MHAAAVTEDDLVADLSRESLQRVWTPKAAGALGMHQATANRPLDWWVGFFNGPLLALRAVGVRMRERVARRPGRVAQGIGSTRNRDQWGQWSERESAARSRLVCSTLNPSEGIEALESVLAGNPSGRCRPDAAGSRSGRLPVIRQLGYFANLVEELDALDDGDRLTFDDRHRSAPRSGLVTDVG